MVRVRFAPGCKEEKADPFSSTVDTKADKPLSDLDSLWLATGEGISTPHISMRAPRPPIAVWPRALRGGGLCGQRPTC